MRELALIFAGWLLGIAGTLGVDRYHERKRTNRLRSGLRLELRRLQALMAVIVWNAVDREGTGSRKDIEWVLSRTERASEEEGIGSFRNKLERMLNLTDDQIGQVVRASSVERKTSAQALQTYSIPFVDAHLSELANLDDAKFASGVLHVVTQLRMFNEVVDGAREYLRMTFDSSLAENNRRIVESNLEQNYSRLGRRARWIADSIEQLSLGAD